MQPVSGRPIAFHRGTRALGTLALVAVVVLALLGVQLASPAAGQLPPDSSAPPELEPRFVPEKPDSTTVLTGFARDRLEVKFVQGSMIRVRDGQLVTLGNDDLGPLQVVLNAHPDVVPSRVFDARSEEELDAERRRLEAASGRELGDKNLYVELSFPQKEAADLGDLLGDLNALEIVELAYPVSEFELDPTDHTPDFQPFQGYRVAAPGGIHADAARQLPGGRGENVQIIDIERWFNPDHEDLPTVAVYPNGDAQATYDLPFDHGTAVLGQLVGQDNGFGVVGLVDQAQAGFVTRANGTPNAIDVAAANADPGDVLLLEVQLAGANGGCTEESQFGCVAVEFQQTNYDAIVTAVAAGIHVVQAAGNGSQNLDAPAYAPTFGARPDSGSIIVGAGAADPAAGVADPTQPGGCTPTQPPRGRLDFSTFGQRVDLQGWGQCVTTAGYGTLFGTPGQAPDDDEDPPVPGVESSNDAYTGRFNGTSSASPIVAAAAGIVSSVAQQENELLTPAEVRDLLVTTGTPQDTTTLGALPGNIGPLPNLAAALGLEADLAVTKVADPDPVAAGALLTYTVTVTNAGPNVAVGAELLDELPDDVTYVGTDPRCQSIPGGDVLCDLGDLGVGASTDVDLPVAVPASLVHDAGGPVTLTNEARVGSSIDDPNLTDNVVTLDSQVVAVADLAVNGVEVAGVPGAALVGEDIDITVTSLVGNLGPSSPMDATLTTTATPSAGASVDPADVATPVPALAVGPDRPVDQAFTMRCDAPGQQQVVFDVEIAPAKAADTDPNPANNTGQVTATLECVTPIALNIRPANAFNRINVGSAQVVPVAALTTEAGEYGLPIAFDATTIVPDSARFGPPDEVWAGTGGAPTHNGIFHIRDSFELDDRTKDGDLDMVLHFRTSASGIASGDVEACMAGQYRDGAEVFAFFGCDAIQTIP